MTREVRQKGDMTEIITTAENISLPRPQVLPAPMPAKTPDQLFAEWLQENNFVVQAVLAAPKGGAVNPENFFPDGWRLVISVVEAKQ